MFSADFFKEIETLRGANLPFCVATIVDGRGSIPQIIGAKAIFTSAGLHAGTIGGGRIEVKCQEVAGGLLAADDPAKNYFVRWNIQKELGMTCGGEVAVYFEVFGPDVEWNIVVFGAGHVSQKLCRFLIELDCQVTCVDQRAEWLDKLPREPRLECLHVEDYSEGVKRITPGATVILMTMGHGSDVPILKNIAKENPPMAYLGLIGSDAKWNTVKKELGEEGVAPDFIDKIICPIGDEIGDNTPPEIAFSIVSQLLKMRGAETKK
ncbi:MAG: XdhC family protein [Rhodospirillales bacterium]|jgi:xanthine dehydrogenase accessory factor|nr:XdhC family protein [Rhodospirillales bacterium]